MSDDASAAKQRMHDFMEHRRALRLRMGESSGSGELALMAELLARLRTSPDYADGLLENALHFTPCVLDLKAHRPGAA